jgi:D-3-phosphoglycerate dehydrogenase / 2-oxoglutarate reductase
VLGYANHLVSDHAMALMFSYIRALWDSKSQLTHKFGSPPIPDIFELHDKILGIIGLGRTGSEFCRKASPLFKQVLTADPYQPETRFNQLSARKVTLLELLENSNVICILCNLTSETNHLLDSKAFSVMRRKPVVINTSRGEVIDEKALLYA